MISASVRIFVLLANCFSPSDAANASPETVPGAMKSALVYPNGAMQFNLISHVSRRYPEAAKSATQVFVYKQLIRARIKPGQIAVAC
jgi:S-methylmethionine-dependent homocysteine/selenocysteine methylase